MEHGVGAGVVVGGMDEPVSGLIPRQQVGPAETGDAPGQTIFPDDALPGVEGLTRHPETCFRDLREGRQQGAQSFAAMVEGGK